MADGVVAPTLVAIMKADFDLDTVDLRYFVTNAAFNAAHDFLNDRSGTIISDVVAVTGETVGSVSGGGNLDHNDFTITNVTGTPVAVQSYDHNGGADSARRLVGWYTTNVPTTPLSGGSLVCTVHASGALSITSSPS